jgi:hypothetical protein
MAKQLVNQLDLIKQLLHDDYLEKGNDAKRLREEGIMERKIISHGIDYLLYRYDPDKVNIFPFFAKTSGLRKICDYFLFATEGLHLHILLIELKLGTESANQQLIASEYLAEFILNSAKRIGIHLTEHIHIKKVRVSEKRASNKRKTKPTLIQYDVNKILNYDYAHDFRLRELLGVL